MDLRGIVMLSLSTDGANGAIKVPCDPLRAASIMSKFKVPTWSIQLPSMRLPVMVRE